MNQNDVEKERYEARLKKQRDDTFFPRAYYEQGLAEGRADGLIGRIHLCEKLLGREPSAKEPLRNRSVAELQSIADQLEAEVLASH